MDWKGKGRFGGGATFAIGTSSSLASGSCLTGDAAAEVEAEASGVAAAETGTRSMRAQI